VRAPEGVRTFVPSRAACNAARNGSIGLVIGYLIISPFAPARGVDRRAGDADAAFVIALIGFVSTVAYATSVERGDPQ